ncbi:peptide/nickel transport system substrate-binding protein [Billgrantia gudaonensis]|uniref:Peptide/nickel transport system substrate-binding protein n=2 Tax=Billgrantia gudaonensis TaxID=376427 RepID=A0A1G8Y9Y3_9GAMM|nr:ABC transporter substrate-binding protein [Halomonas gudaonensis]SDJ99658.1 peptide/nickel transport system substrate-binding protein [Halomonas gudaonensis]
MKITRTVLSRMVAGAALSVAFSVSAQAGSLTVASPQDPGSWDPIDTFLVNWASVATNIFDGLTYRGPDLELVPGLATEWEELDDGTRIRFTLREGVTFHNGEAFNAEAVKFTFERLLGDEGAQGPQRSNYTAIESVEVIDDYTVDFHLSEPDPVLLTKLAGYGAMIVPPEYLAEHGDDHFNTHPVGTGPFKVVEYNPREDVQLEAFDEHWGGAPKLDEVTYRFISEPSTAVAELQAGRVDIVIPPTIPIGMIDTIKNHDEASIVSVPSPTVEALRFDTQSGITADERVRKAMIMAVDRQAIIDSILAGEGEVIASFQGAQSFGNDPEMEPLPFDPQRARELLDEAGVEPGATVQIDVRGNDATFGEVAQVVASYLQGVGITASIQPYETNVLLNDIIPEGRTGEMFQQKWGGWTFDFDNTAYLMYHTGERWNPYDSDAELDAMLEAQRSITDQGKREEMLQEIARYTQDRALEMPLYSINALYGVRDRVKNFDPAPDNRIRLTEVDVAD